MVVRLEFAIWNWDKLCIWNRTEIDKRRIELRFGVQLGRILVYIGNELVAVRDLCFINNKKTRFTKEAVHVRP